ncbi:MAG TPA: hypothetical protein VFP68_06445, partial [Burkholderiaceae bacterium]|nr:hypothetical protein [Burkholderiaceae bacterium]
MKTETAEGIACRIKVRPTPPKTFYVPGHQLHHVQQHMVHPGNGQPSQSAAGGTSRPTLSAPLAAYVGRQPRSREEARSLIRQAVSANLRQHHERNRLRFASRELVTLDYAPSTRSLNVTAQSPDGALIYKEFGFFRDETIHPAARRQPLDERLSAIRRSGSPIGEAIQAGIELGDHDLMRSLRAQHEDLHQ